MKELRPRRKLKIKNSVQWKTPYKAHKINIHTSKPDRQLILTTLFKNE